MMRVFVAIEISNNKVINSIKNFQTTINIDAKPVKVKNLHFTLQFFCYVFNLLFNSKYCNMRFK